MKDKPESFHIYIENVLEDEPYMLADLLSGLKSNNIHCCLDMGHANCMSEVPLKSGQVYWHHLHPMFIFTITTAATTTTSHRKGHGKRRKGCGNFGGEDTSITYTLECGNSLEGFTWLEESGFLTIPIIESRGG